MRDCHQAMLYEQSRAGSAAPEVAAWGQAECVGVPSVGSAAGACAGTVAALMAIARNEGVGALYAGVGLTW